MKFLAPLAKPQAMVIIKPSQFLLYLKMPTSQQESEKPSVTSIPETTTDQKTEASTTTTTTAKKTTTTTTTTVATKDAPWTPPPPVATFGPSNGYMVVPSMMSMGLVYIGVTYLSEMI
ncbi:hypothetical protein CONCODRAFT_84747 [Conidiobolus coronatus NRRL 28638]|uniref:Uncharacterized protein n=1 Tax=Conidiobolus coronatus (strain ATCC 28846 / CBS 209.66 / NRRL 28638) TaxID=796925 RepID=A0A137P8M7_CONC2|nr:hypothetical protein CONCODRAFT_84747 [Conidiobolus coronatus NRRL 28638]|eukprot:KXN71332.1 hypothetical protein CONCODRAFT_84747 [Conidiobolus coronatus NRRL 28638]